MELFLQKLERFARFNDLERASLEGTLHERRVRLQRGEEIVVQGEKPEFMHLFLDGWSVRQRTLANGKQQVLGILLGGDVCGLSPDLPLLADHSIVACTDVHVARLRLSDYHDLVNRHARLSDAFRWLLTLDQACQREWTVNVGRRSGVARMAALFCELYHRQEWVGLAQGARVPFPLNQAALADVVALSTVHVNRLLQHMRKIGLIRFDGVYLDIRDIERLEALASFDATYLGAGSDSSNRPSEVIAAF